MGIWTQLKLRLLRGHFFLQVVFVILIFDFIYVMSYLVQSKMIKLFLAVCSIE